MPRAPIVLAATAAGLAATLGFHAHRPAPATATTAAAPATTTSSTRTSSSPSASGSVTGDAVQTQYGPVQLKVTISGGKNTPLQARQLPPRDPPAKGDSPYPP